MLDEQVTRTIIGAAYRVYNTLGFGFLESVYEKSLLIKITKQGIKAQRQEKVLVYYDGQTVGSFRADVLVEGRIILELKSIQQLVKPHEVQLVNYLVATRCDIGLLIKFGPDKVEIKRKYRSLDQLKRETRP